MTNEVIEVRSLIASSTKNNSLILKSWPFLKLFIFISLGILIIESILAIIYENTKKSNVKKVIEQIQQIILIFVIAIFGFAILISVIGLFQDLKR